MKSEEAGPRRCDSRSSRGTNIAIPVVLALVGAVGWSAAAQVVRIPLAPFGLRICAVTIDGLGSAQQICEGADEPCMFIIQEGRILIVC